MTSLANNARLISRESQNRPLAVWFAGAALFTISWDRLLSFSVGTLNVKMPIILFGIAACFLVIDTIRNDGARSGTPFFFVPYIVLFVDLCIVAVYSDHTTTALLQTVVLAVGSLVPAVVTYSVAVRHAALDFLLTRLIQGGYLAAAFGCYQLFAGKLGLPLPQKFVYAGFSGGVERIAAFNYEPAYFGHFIILVMAALLARAEIRRQSSGLEWKIAFFLAVLFLANTRASYLTVPTFFALVFLGVKTRAARTATGKVLMAGMVIAVLVLVVWQTTTSRVEGQLDSLFDPNETSSNAPRLAVLNLVWDVWQQHPYGIGPGNLIHYLDFTTTSSDWAGTGLVPVSFNTVIVNNIWLQALVDGGVVAFLAHIAIVVVAVVVCYRRSSPVSAILISGWVTLVLVAGMVTSTFYDLKFGALLGLAAAAAGIGSSSTRPGECPDQRG